jgi:hypothetical protein
VASRERIVPPQEVVSSATPTPASAPAQPPAQTYSEQKVTEPAPAPPPSSREPVAAAPATPTRPAAASATPAPAAAPQRGQLIVRSLPSHAGVTVNGTWRGRTPLTLDDLRFGDYSIRVVQPGYAVAREEFTLSARTPSHNFTTRLERVSKASAAAPAAPPAAEESPASFAGSLYVDSRPRGAQVTIDGRNVGQTPVSVPDVKIGMHVVRIEMDGKKPVTATPRITAGKLERVTVSLEDR